MVKIGAESQQNPHSHLGCVLLLVALAELLPKVLKIRRVTNKTP